MSVTIQLVDGPLSGAPPLRVPGAGALVRFEGAVRPMEDGSAIAGLDYTTYDPMAAQELERLAQQVLEEFGLMEVHVVHSRGRVLNHEISFRLDIASAHRKESLQAMDQFIDRMKQVVPIWKAAVPG
jgi:molybdopterin synthase catalytic subunit